MRERNVSSLLLDPVLLFFFILSSILLLHAAWLGMINTFIFGLHALLFQEMMGLAYFMLDQSRKEAEYCMENAFTTYLVCMV